MENENQNKSQDLYKHMPEHIEIFSLENANKKQNDTQITFFQDQSGSNSMPSHKSIIYKLVVVLFIMAGLGLMVYFYQKGVVFQPKTAQIDLNIIPDKIDILSSTSNLKLSRGNYIYSMTKEETLNNKLYYVESINNFSIDSTHQTAPEDAYLTNFTVIPEDDASAMRIVNNSTAFNSGFTMEINSDAGKKAADQMMNDVKHYNEVKATIGILPENPEIIDIAKNVRPGDTINISGIHFKHSSITKNGREKQLPVCLQNLDVFYATKFEIIK
jgi:hypothetical protein